MKFTYYFLFTIGIFGNIYSFMQDELVDLSFNYFSERIKTLEEVHVDTIIKEINLIAARDGLDKALVIEKLTDRVRNSVKYHAQFIRGKWHHPAAKPALLLALAGVGLIGLTYGIYNKWSSPLNTEFEANANSLKPYGATINEEHTVEHYVKLTVYKNTVVCTLTRNLSAAENEIIEKTVDSLVKLRKSQNWLWEYIECPCLTGALFSFLFSSFFYQEIYNCNTEDHKLHYEKYQMILQKILSAQL